MFLLLLVIVPCVLGAPTVIEAQARLIQAKVEEGVHLDEVFADFMRVYNKTYRCDEEGMRREIFKFNVKRIQAHNHLYYHGEKSYSLGVNHLSDMTHTEFLNAYTSAMKPRGPTNATMFLAPCNVQLPSSVDWRQQGYVTPVKNQHTCGACWAFSTTGSLEGQHKRKSGQLVSLSEQQLVDCTKGYGPLGCKGGEMNDAFQYIAAAGGLDGEADYPYTAVEGQCHFQRSEVRATVTGIVTIPQGSEDILMQAVATVGPISIAIDGRDLQSYSSGVYNNPSCSSSHPNHGVLVVGYGTTQDSQDYWLVKNSWGAAWGMNGYIMMARNKGNQCGIASMASYPNV